MKGILLPRSILVAGYVIGDKIVLSPERRWLMLPPAAKAWRQYERKNQKRKKLGRGGFLSSRQRDAGRIRAETPIPQSPAPARQLSEKMPDAV